MLLQSTYSQANLMFDQFSNQTYIMMRKKTLLAPLFMVALGSIWIWPVINGEYLIGVGSYDMTGPAAEVNMMGYANIDQNTAGIHFRLRARTFIVTESSTGPRFVFVNLDAGMASQLVTIKVVHRLQSRYPKPFTYVPNRSKINELIVYVMHVFLSIYLFLFF